MRGPGTSLANRFAALVGLNEEWRIHAACADVDPELFHPVGKWESAGEQPRLKAARQVCSRCSVTTECLLDADASKDMDSVRGGLTPLERSRARANRGAA